MEGTALRRRLIWRLATLVDAIHETRDVRSLVFEVGDWSGHLPGQHVDVRLTAEDGYQAQRSYSIASAPADMSLQLTVESLRDGEVSPYLVDELSPGDQLELRGPVGGYFVWDGRSPSPLLLVAGGSGVVPLMSMLRHRAVSGRRVPARLLYSSHGPDDIIYRDELERMAAADPDLKVLHVLTRRQPPGWTGYARRIDGAMLAEVAWPPESEAEIFVCGPTALVEVVASGLRDLGHAPERIRTERFGPTGR
ncbi:MAG TPA: ferredoxin reductase [Nitriliruptorales bacterium]|nr:ferredoxin reductase [Nitriliruptorales bacterium]